MVVEAEITYATMSQSPVKRFFLITYFYNSLTHAVPEPEFLDTVIITDGTFPSRKLISETFFNKVCRNISGSFTIFEFNNESDYNQFIGE